MNGNVKIKNKIYKIVVTFQLCRHMNSSLISMECQFHSCSGFHCYRWNKEYLIVASCSLEKHVTNQFFSQLSRSHCSYYELRTSLQIANPQFIFHLHSLKTYKLYNDTFPLLCCCCCSNVFHFANNKRQLNDEPTKQMEPQFTI